MSGYRGIIKETNELPPELLDIIEEACFEYEAYTNYHGKYTKVWRWNGKIHRENDMPAVIETDGAKYWYHAGQINRDGDKPAIVYADETKKWFQNGLLHRDGDKPAVICSNGDRFWYKNGEFFRENDGPVVVRADGFSIYKNLGLSVAS